ncbi:MAG: hypothetical protein PHW00_02935 [Clostridia bacterium]|nr:hypothetical protein [Clostridia bacterium]
MSITCKFGGSSATILNWCRIKEIVNQHADRKYVVVSAMGRNYIGDIKTTDILLQLYSQCTSITQILAHPLYHNMVNRHIDMVRSVNMVIDVERICRCALLQNHPYTVDFVASRGEYITGYLTAQLLGYDFIDSKDVVVFDSRHRLVLGNSIKRISSAIRDKQGVVMSGYYGSYKDNIITFDRGGSDISGALLALASNSYLYENYIDVDGFLQVNPTQYLNAQLLSHIGYTQLLSLNQMGADVIHRDSLVPCIDADIPIALKSIYAPYAIGTLISSSSNNNGLLAITSDYVDYCVIEGRTTQSVQQAISKCNVNVLHRTDSQTVFICASNSIIIDKYLLNQSINIIKAHHTKILYGGQMPIARIFDCLHTNNVQLLYSYADKYCCGIITNERIVDMLYPVLQ